MVAPLILILLLPFFASQSQASDSFNDFSNDNVEEAGIEPSRFQKFLAKFEQEQHIAKFEQEQHIAKFEQEQQMKLEAEDQMVGESSSKVARQVPDEPLPQVFGHPLTLLN